MDGTIELINSANSAYLASTHYLLPPSSVWQEVVASTNACAENMVVRIGANKSFSATLMVVDDLSVIRYY